jgi:hypothetical protein
MKKVTAGCFVTIGTTQKVMLGEIWGGLLENRPLGYPKEVPRAGTKIFASKFFSNDKSKMLFHVIF